MAAPPQQNIGHYRITSKLGEGGMGEVWRATDTRLNREVAIKVLPAAVAGDAMRLARFTREAQVLASLNHPNIAAIYGVEEHALVMELVEGPTLAERISGRAMPLDEVLPIARQMAEALGYAHDKGVIHRDLKPANIKVTPDGTVKILDFGLAKAMTGDSSASAPGETATVSSAATLAGTILGTAACMAPEQARGQNVDRRADVWAFGVVLYEMLTGERPFGGATVSDTLAAVLKEAPDLERVPAQTRRLLRACLEKDPKRRLAAVQDGMLLLEAGEGPATVPRPRWRALLPWALLGIAVIAGVAAWWSKPAPAATRVVSRFSYPLPAGQAFTRFGRHVLAISPDGTRIVYVANQQLYLRPLDQLQAQPIPGTNEDPIEPVFSPDGQWIAYFHPGSPGVLRKVAVVGGVPVTLCQTVSRPLGVSWGSGTIAFGQYLPGKIDAIEACPDTGGTARTLMTVNPRDGVVTQPQLLSDGRVLFAVVPVSGAATDEGRIEVQGLDGGDRGAARLIVTGGSNPHLLPNGRLVYIHDATLFGVRLDAKRLAAIGGPAPLLAGVAESGASWVGQFAISVNGTLAYVPGTAASPTAPQVMVWVDRQGHEQPLAAPPRAYEYPRVSPDGTKIAVGALDEQHDIWIWDIAKQMLERLTFGGGFKFYPTWMPGGRRLVFASAASATTSPRPVVFREAEDGAGALETLAPDGAGGIPQSISPDGKWLVLRTAFEPDGLALLPLAGGGPATPLALGDAGFNYLDGEVSPDGRWIAYVSDESGQEQVYVRPFPAVAIGRWQVSAGGGNAPAWSRNARELFYVNYGVTAPRLMAVPIQPGTAFSFGAPQPLFDASQFSFSTGRNYDVAPDGRFLFLKAAAGATAAAAANSIVVVNNWSGEVAARVK